MIAVEDTVLILLAAGRSDRFGEGNKLEQQFLARPLGLHVAVALEDMPFRERIVVVDGCTIDYAAHRFTVLHNNATDRDMASSVRMGVDCARARDAKAVMIALWTTVCGTSFWGSTISSAAALCSSKPT